jgi:transposase InsO family protein
METVLARRAGGLFRLDQANPLQNTSSRCAGAAFVFTALLFNHQVMGWSLQTHMQASLVKHEWPWRGAAAGRQRWLIFHSDWGGQYCNREFQDALKGWGMRSSMNRKGNCWDNARTESF